ncbi:MAG: hypothetical protein J6U39_03815, partial [Clostridia bacterium]|nr:hypothetical protein [Clostridia bacterium]
MIEYVPTKALLSTSSNNRKNYNLLQRRKKSEVTDEVLYKEIYGFIFGKATTRPITKEEYLLARKGAFSGYDAEFIYDLSSEYLSEIRSRGLLDLNLACAEVSIPVPTYSLVILDEVQDFTERQLAFFRSLAVKLFCVGDASQMVNPAYFSFARLKDLLYKKDVTD